MADAKAPKDPAAELRAAREAWERETLGPVIAREGERLPRFETQALHWPVERLATPADLEAIGFDYLRDVGFPGEYPYTRGTEPNGYRSRLWTMTQVTGFGTGAQ
jgi:methylmalonyl-CoA mutase N-terminal domain/subunit